MGQKPRHFWAWTSNETCTYDWLCLSLNLQKMIEYRFYVKKVGYCLEYFSDTISDQDPERLFRIRDRPDPYPQHRSSVPVLRIRDILQRIRIRASDQWVQIRLRLRSCYFRSLPLRRQQSFSVYYFLKVHLHHFSKTKSHKKGINVFLTIFAWWSGSWRPKKDPQHGY